MDLLDRLDKHGDKTKWIGLGIGFVTLLVGYLAYKHASTAAGTSSVAVQPGVPSTSDSTDIAGSVTGDQLDTMLQQQGVQFTQLESEIQGLQGQISSVGPTTATGTGSGIGPIQGTGQIQQGGGYWWGPGNETGVVDTGGSPSLIGSIFTWLSPGAAAVNPKVQRYYQPSPGVFLPNPKTPLPAGTPQFTKA